MNADSSPKQFELKCDACYSRLNRQACGYSPLVVSRTLARMLAESVDYSHDERGAPKELLWKAALGTLHSFGGEFRDALVDFLEETHGE